MANYDTLKSAIRSVIRQNGNNEITGPILQQTLISIIDALGSGYLYVGVANINTNPGTPDQNVFYLCGPGTYTNFAALTVPDGAIGILKYNGTWTVATVAVGKNYDGYLGIVNGSELSATDTQSKYIDKNGNLVNIASFTLKTFPVTGGKSYLISGLEANNVLTCGWAAYEGGTKVAFGANNIGSNEAVARIPDNANTLYVCQPNYGNLPPISVKETTSVIDEMETRLDNIENIVGTGGVIDISNIDVANYALLISETYTNKIWNNGQLIDDVYSERNATSLVMIDKTKDIYPGTQGYSEVVFFDANKNFISKIQSYWVEPILANNIPASAVYMAFNYYRGAIMAEDGKFYVTTRPDNIRLTRLLYATKNKVKGTRPIIQINLSDSQETIFKKMVDAIYIEDCDVHFENGAYTFDSIFYLMKSKYNWADAFELPLGGNCRYYFNNSTLTGGYGSQTPSSGNVVETNSSILGTHRLDGQTFELHDGELIANGMVYCVHDEASGGAGAYVHKYENMVMRYNTGQYTQYLAKCIGGGTGLNGSVVVNGCKFYNQHTTPEISWHGHNLSVASVFKLFVSNSFFVNGIGLHQMAENETGYLFLSASLVPVVPSGERWTVFSTI